MEVKFKENEEERIQKLDSELVEYIKNLGRLEFIKELKTICGNCPRVFETDDEYFNIRTKKNKDGTWRAKAVNVIK